MLCKTGMCSVPLYILNPNLRLYSRASTTAAVIASLDNRITALSRQTVQEKQAKSAYEDQYNRNLKDVADRQREAKFNAQRATNKPKGPSGPSKAGLAFIEKEKQREAARKENERKEKEAAENAMDVDEPADAKGKSRK